MANDLRLKQIRDFDLGLPVPTNQSDDGKLIFYDFDSDKWITDDNVTHGTSVINAKKSTAGTITKGTPVYLVGFDSDVHTVEAADASNPNKMPVIGIASENLTNIAGKHVTTFGKVVNVNTSAFSVGNILYMGVTAGQFTVTRPSGENTSIQRIAKVLKVGTSNGQILVINTASVDGLPNLGNNKIWIGDASANPISVTYTAISNVVEDTTPQLGGSLDVNNNKIISTGFGDIDIEPGGTGNVIIGNFEFDADQIVGAGQDNYVLTYNNATGLISLEAVSIGFTSFTITGDSGTPQTVTNGNSVTISGGTGLSSVASDTDTITINHDAHTGDVTGSTALTIANGAVTYGKIQNIAANNVFLGNDNGNGSSVQEITASEARTILNVENGSTADPTLIKTIVVESPADIDYIPIWRTNVAITIQEAHGMLAAAGSVQVRLYWDTDYTASGQTAIGTATTLTTTTEASINIASDPTIPANSWIFLDIGTVTTPQTTVVNIRYTE